MIQNQRVTNKIVLVAFLFAFLFLVASVSGVHAASTVYVNPTVGDDSNDGSINHPYKTIHQAMKNVDVNGTVKIAKGIYKGKGNTKLTIVKNMKIIGQHQKKTIINGEGNNWIFKISKGVNVTIFNLTLTNGIAKKGGAIYNDGNLKVKRCTFTRNKATGNKATCDGGAIYNQGNINSLSGCTFKNNKATYNGGAISNQGNINSLSGCTFKNNKACFGGGAIDNYGTLIVSKCTFAGNEATFGDGGAIFNGVNYMYTVSKVINDRVLYDVIKYNVGTISLNGCKFINNTASNGGAICNYGTIDRLSGCTFTNNTVNWSKNWSDDIYKGGNTDSLSGSCLKNYGEIACCGGAIYNDGTINLSGCTFTNNKADNDGGAISNRGTISLNGCKFRNNKAYLGGAINNYRGTISLRGYYFKNNTASWKGGAINNYRGTISLIDCKSKQHKSKSKVIINQCK